MEKENMIIAIDFDGTIVEHEYPKIGRPIMAAKEIINALYDAGHIIIIWTVRSETFNAVGKMKKWLDDNGYKYHRINEDADVVLDDPNWTSYSRKIYADLYIDDRAFGWKHGNYFTAAENWINIGIGLLGQKETCALLNSLPWEDALASHIRDYFDVLAPNN